jgi:hypothetical protein
MKTLIGGGIAAFLGLVGIITFFDKFLYVVAGTVPLILLLGGGLAVYMEFDEFRGLLLKNKGSDTPSADSQEKDEEIEKNKKEIDDLKQEIEGLKKDKKEDDDTL